MVEFEKKCSFTFTLTNEEAKELFKYLNNPTKVKRKEPLEQNQLAAIFRYLAEHL